MPTSYDPKPQPEHKPPDHPPNNHIPLGMKVLMAVVGTFAASFALISVRDLVRDATKDFRPNLQGVAVYTPIGRTRICSRQDLHHCTVRMGLGRGLENIAGPFDLIRAAATCDGQETAASTACTANEYGTVLRQLCMAEQGVIDRRIEGHTRETDPRDPPSSLDDHTTIVRCDEGESTLRSEEPNI